MDEKNKKDDEEIDHLIEKGEYESAQKRCDNLIQAEPKNAFWYMKRSKTKIPMFDNAGAIDDCNRAIELDSKLVLAYNGRGVARFGLEDYAGAIIDYDKAIELEPKLAFAYSNRGGAKGRLGEFDGAIVDCKKAIELDPELTTVYYILSGIKIDQAFKSDEKLRRGHFEEALKALDRVIELKPEPMAYSMRASILYWLDRKEEMEQILSKAIEILDAEIKSNPRKIAHYIEKANVYSLNIKKAEFWQQIDSILAAIQAETVDWSDYQLVIILEKIISSKDSWLIKRVNDKLFDKLENPVFKTKFSKLLSHYTAANPGWENAAPLFERLDSEQIMMVSTDNMELEHRIRTKTLKKMEGIRFTLPNLRERRMRMDYKQPASAIFSMGYLSELIDWMIKSGAEEARLTLGNDAPLTVEFESVDGMSSEQRMAKTTFIIAPRIELNDDTPAISEFTLKEQKEAAVLKNENPTECKQCKALFKRSGKEQFCPRCHARFQEKIGEEIEQDDESLSAALEESAGAEKKKGYNDEDRCNTNWDDPKTD